MIGAGVWVLVGLAAVALTGPVGALVVGVGLVVFWLLPRKPKK